MPAVSRRSRRAVPLVLTVAGSLIVTASAQAGTVSVSGSTMSFLAAPGETNDVRADPQFGGVLFTDASAPLSAGAGCTALVDGVLCAYPDVPRETAIALDLLDGNDRGFIDDRIGNIAAMSVFGGPGNDFAHVGGSGPRDAVADGGPGDDSLESFMNNTGVLTLAGGSGDDELSGNEIGRHTLLTGGNGDDHIEFSFFIGPGPVFEGGAGNDTIADNSGGSSIGQIAAGSGFDTLTFAGVTGGHGTIDLEQCPTCSIERVVGSDSDDILLGDAGSTLFVGGDGADLIEPRGGMDAVSAGRGADQIHVDGDRRTDVVSCGPGQDEVTADRRDIVARNCETVTR